MQRTYTKRKMGIIRLPEGFGEGELLYRYHNARFKNNKNVLGVVVGSTGSAKSYTALRICEIEYKNRFNKPFPIENVTFSIEETMKRINDLQNKGCEQEILLSDDTGASGYGALEFQNRTSRMFSYILQSFRKLRIGLIMTLPVLTMLNKQARQLLHYQLVTSGIDYATQTSRIKPFFHQLNLTSGKSYWKYPIININNRSRKIKMLNYLIPSPELREAYEKKKSEFLKSLTKSFMKEINMAEMKRNGVKMPLDWEFEAYRLRKVFGKDMKHWEIAEKVGKDRVSVTTALGKVENYLKLTTNRRIPYENDILSVQNAV